MRVLVTGARGFVGARLVPRLEAQGATVIPRDQELDVADPDALRRALTEHRPDAIVHLAALAFVPASFREPERVYRVNFLGSRNVLAAALDHTPRPRVLLVGSGAAYGLQPPGAPHLDESSPLRPDNPYATSKAASDLLGACFTARGLQVVRARPFNHIGPGQREEFVAAAFARQIAEMEAGMREPLLQVGNLDSVRDFLDVDDVVAAYLHLLDPAVPPGAYNVASGVPISARQLLEGLLAGARVEPRLEVDRARFRPTDRWVGNPGKLRRVTGWAPRIPLRETLSRILEDWRQRVSDG